MLQRTTKECIFLLFNQVNVNLTQKMRREESSDKTQKNRKKKDDDKENYEPVPNVQSKWLLLIKHCIYIVKFTI